VSIETQVRGWLTSTDIQVTDPKNPCPPSACRVALDIFTSRSADGIHWCGVRQTCVLPDNPLASASKGMNVERSWSTIRLAGQPGAEGFSSTAARAIVGILADIAGDREARPIIARREARFIHHGSWSDDGKWDRVTEFAFSELKIRRQPPPPPYPQAAIQEGAQGTVVVEPTIDPKGKPVMALALSGPQPLLMTAVRYALGWEFEPARLNGEAMAARFKLTMPFKLK
jgi:TonB family protein